MDSVLVDLTKAWAEQELIQGVVPRLVVLRLVAAEVAVDVAPDAPHLQNDQALKERVSPVNQTQAAKVAMAAFKEALEDSKALVVSVVVHLAAWAA